MNNHPELVWVYDIHQLQKGPLHQLQNLEFDTTLGGEEVLTFDIMANDPKIEWLEVDHMVRYKDKMYRIAPWIDAHDDSRAGQPYRKVTCQALWYRLGERIRFGQQALLGKTTLEGLTELLLGTNWTVGDVARPGEVHSAELKHGSILEWIRLWASISGVEVRFDSFQRIVHFDLESGTDTPHSFRWGKNVTSIERTYDPPEATRLYPIGSNELGVSSVHPEGLQYVENFDWYTSKGVPLVTARARYSKMAVWEDSNYITALDLYDEAVKRLAALSKPTISYVGKVIDIADAIGVDELDLAIGDTVNIFDKDLGMDIKARVVRFVRRPYEPENNEITLSFIKPGLNTETLLSGSSSGTSAEMRMLVDDNSAATITSSVYTVCNINITAATTSNGVGGVHFAGVGVSTGILEVWVSLDGVAISNRVKRPFTHGDNIEIGIPTYYSGAEQGDHTLIMHATIAGGSGTVTIPAGESKMWFIVTGALGISSAYNISNLVVGEEMTYYVTPVTDMAPPELEFHTPIPVEQGDSPDLDGDYEPTEEFDDSTDIDIDTV